MSGGGTAAPRRRREWAANLLLLAGSLLLGFVLLEAGLRLFGSPGGDWYAAGPGRRAFLRDHVQRNSRGFRDREFSTVKPPATVRLLAVGDSFTFGDGIADVEDTWPKVLERRLAEHGPHEVYNLGVPGTNTAFQRGMLIERAGYDLRPDRLVVGFVLNDPEPPGANLTIVPRRLYPPLIPLRGLDARLSRASFAYAQLRRLKNTLLERLGLKETYTDYIHALYDPHGEWWNGFVSEARGLVDDARARGVPVTVALFPMFHDLERYPFAAEHARAGELFERAGADVLDLLDTFEGMDTAALRVAPGDAHPNERAHRLAAEAIAAHLLSRPGAARGGGGGIPERSVDEQ